MSRVAKVVANLFKSGQEVSEYVLDVLRASKAVQHGWGAAQAKAFVQRAIGNDWQQVIWQRNGLARACGFSVELRAIAGHEVVAGVLGEEKDNGEGRPGARKVSCNPEKECKLCFHNQGLSYNFAVLVQKANYFVGGGLNVPQLTRVCHLYAFFAEMQLIVIRCSSHALSYAQTNSAHL